MGQDEKLKVKEFFINLLEQNFGKIIVGKTSDDYNLALSIFMNTISGDSIDFLTRNEKLLLKYKFGFIKPNHPNTILNELKIKLNQTKEEIIKTQQSTIQKSIAYIVDLEKRLSNGKLDVSMSELQINSNIVDIFCDNNIYKLKDIISLTEEELKKMLNKRDYDQLARILSLLDFSTEKRPCSDISKENLPKEEGQIKQSLPTPLEKRQVKSEILPVATNKASSKEKARLTKQKNSWLRLQRKSILISNARKELGLDILALVNKYHVSNSVNIQNRLINEEKVGIFKGITSENGKTISFENITTIPFYINDLPSFSSKLESLKQAGLVTIEDLKKFKVNFYYTSNKSHISKKFYYEILTLGEKEGIVFYEIGEAMDTKNQYAYERTKKIIENYFELLKRYQILIKDENECNKIMQDKNEYEEEARSL